MGKSRDVASQTSLLRSVLDRLASVKFALSVVVVIIAFACLVGTILPQGTDVERYLVFQALRDMGT